MPHLTFIIFFFALGACIGSFLNVVVWRLPRGESLVTPPSRCPVCEHRLAWYDNIPVFGWLFLRGRCRYCHTPISAQYPTVELITGLLFVFYYVMYFMVGETGPCWLEVIPSRGEFGGPLVVHHFVESIQKDWAFYVLVVFTISALLAAGLIDAKLFWIPHSIPLLMAAIGLLYHSMLDHPKTPGAIYVESGVTGALAVGAGVGLLVSGLLVATGKMKRSFSDGWPALEVEKTPPPEAKPGWIARLVGGWIEKFRGELTAEQQRTLKKFAAQAKEREAELEREAKAEAEKNPITYKEFSPGDIRREIRREMAFLIIPMLLGIIAVSLVLFVKPVARWWNPFVLQHHWVSGFLGSLLGALVGGFVVWLTRILGSMAFGREAMGMGDVDLMFGVGAIVGGGPATVAFFVAPFFGLAIAVYMFIVGKRRELPYGPYLAMGTAFVLLYYCPVADYLRPGLTILMMKLGGAVPAAG